MLDRLIAEVQSWSRRVLEVPCDGNQDWPVCPFASKAWASGSANVAVIDDWSDVPLEISTFLQSKYAVTVLVKLEPDEWDMEDFVENVRAANRKWSEQNVYILGLHPWDENTFISSVTEENEELDLHDEYVFLFLFRLDELGTASRAIEEQGYYDKWKPEIYYNVLARRKLKND
tara:strand:- start:1235 stop:1756 length:522 start_codon:yes stop_codon:yes gene_type:complete